MFRFLRKKELRDLLLGCALLLAGGGLAAAPEASVAGAKEGLTLCFNIIVPSLFPFFVLSSLVVDLGLAAYLGRAMEPVMRPLFRVSGRCSAALVLGFVGGYPIGARTALQLYEEGQCTKEEAERLLAFCNNSGPAFILGVVGAGVFADRRVGLLLYLTHAAASLLVGLVFRFHGGTSGRGTPSSRTPIRAVRLAAAFPAAVGKALTSTLSVCAFVVVFSVMLRLLSRYGILSAAARVFVRFGMEEAWAERLITGLLEMSSGVSSLSGTGVGGVPMAAFMLGWAGLSVHCQVLAFLGDSDLSPRTYLVGKLLHGLVAAALTRGLTKLFPLSAPVSVCLSEQADSIAGPKVFSVLAISLGSAFLLWALWAGVCAVLVKKSGGKLSHHRV